MERLWGWWTQHKLQILGDYLQAFTRASSRSPERIYLDLFAGVPKNRSRDTNEEILGSVRRALDCQPPFTRLALFELGHKAKILEDSLRSEFPNEHRIRVYGGDCNVSISDALQDLKPYNRGPAFAFVDQHDNEIKWSTLGKLANFRDSPWKTEMWILFATGLYGRGLGIRQDEMNARYGESLTEMLGSEEWVPIVRAKREKKISPEKYRFEMVNLMRWRLENVLGYSESHAFTMKNTNGNDLYDMIFVSDHKIGDRIMRHLYGKAAQQHEAMRQHALNLRRIKRTDAKREAEGEFTLFAVDQNMLRLSPAGGDPGKLYEPERPLPPYGSR